MKIFSILQNAFAGIFDFKQMSKIYKGLSKNGQIFIISSFVECLLGGVITPSFLSFVYNALTSNVISFNTVFETLSGLIISSIVLNLSKDKKKFVKNFKKFLTIDLIINFVLSFILVITNNWLLYYELLIVEQSCVQRFICNGYGLIKEDIFASREERENYNILNTCVCNASALLGSAFFYLTAMVGLDKNIVFTIFLKFLLESIDSIIMMKCYDDLKKNNRITILKEEQKEKEEEVA